MKVLVTGAKGQLGYDVVKELQKRQIECCGVDIEDFDITDYQATAKYIMEYKPEAIIHCSAYTAVDKAEDEQELCHKVNVIGTENIAKCCRELDAKMIYISTDYVFPGNGDNFYEVDDPEYEAYIPDHIKNRFPKTYNIFDIVDRILLPKDKIQNLKNILQA